MRTLPPSSTTAARPARSLLAPIALLLALALPAPGQGIIDLKSTVRPAPGEPLTLSMLADLSGPDALRWADLPINDEVRGDDGPIPAVGRESRRVAGSETITIESIRELIERQAGVHWGKLILRGSTCTILRTDPEASAMLAGGVAPAKTDTASSGPTVRTLAEGRIASFVGAAASDVRITFGEHDADILDTPTTGRIVEIQPIGRSDRLPMTVRVFAGETIIVDGIIRATVEIRRDALVARGPISRGEALTTENTAIESRWLGMVATPADPLGTLGSVARGRIRPGQLIASQDIEPPVVVKKGDLVNVDCLSGSIVLRRTMRSTEQARDGEIVTVQALEGKKTAQARMNGRGRAVMVLDPLLAASGTAPPTAPAVDNAGSAVHGSIAGAPADQTRAATDGTSIDLGGIRIQKRSSTLTEGKRIDRFSKLANKSVEPESDGRSGR